jgi:hypothetical protein
VVFLKKEYVSVFEIKDQLGVVMHGTSWFNSTEGETISQDFKIDPFVMPK